MGICYFWSRRDRENNGCRWTLILPWEPWEDSEERECWDWDIFWQVGCGSWVLAGEISQAPKGSLEQRKNSWGWISHNISQGHSHGCYCFVPRVGVWLCFHSSTRERNRGRETPSVCAVLVGVTFHQKSIPALDLVVLVCSTKWAQTAELGVKWDFLYKQVKDSSRKGLQCFPEVWMYLFCKGIIQGWVTPGWKCFVCSSPVLSPRPPALLYPRGMWLPQQLPAGESVFEMAVGPTHCLGMQAKAFYWIEELTQSQERRVKLWKLPQQVRHWVRCVATLSPGRGCALSPVWWQFLHRILIHVGFCGQLSQWKQSPWLWPALCADVWEVFLLATSVWTLPKLNRRDIHHFIVIDLLIWSSSEFYWLDNSKLKSSYWMKAME